MRFSRALGNRYPAQGVCGTRAGGSLPGAWGKGAAEGTTGAVSPALGTAWGLQGWAARGPRGSAPHRAAEGTLSHSSQDGRLGTFLWGIAFHPDAAAEDRSRSRSCLVTPVNEAGCRGESGPVQQPSCGQGRRAAMLDPDSGLSLTIARIVQRLKGSSLHSQLERQARVSPDLALCPQARLPFPLPLPGALFPVLVPPRPGAAQPSLAQPSPAYAASAGAGARGLPSLPLRRGRRAGWLVSRAVFIVSPPGTEGFRSEYEDYPLEISLLQIVPKMNGFVFQSLIWKALNTAPPFLLQSAPEKMRIWWKEVKINEKRTWKYIFVSGKTVAFLYLVTYLHSKPDFHITAELHLGCLRLKLCQYSWS